ncbi:hypothetical protein PTI98_008406 [Pleurotus ostreatus]|nr:hypothetical protein PTI98_008406 [Pleurotus ostreatus]
MASIGKHEFKPQQLGKLIPSITAKATTTTYTLEDSALRATDTAPIKDLPDFSTFMQALGVYFQILYRFVGTTGNIQAVIDVAVSTQGYTNLLHEYSRYFTYPAILTYVRDHVKGPPDSSVQGHGNGRGARECGRTDKRSTQDLASALMLHPPSPAVS